MGEQFKELEKMRKEVNMKKIILGSKLAVAGLIFLFYLAVFITARI